MINTPYFTYETAVTYPDLGMDRRLDHRGLLRAMQEAAALASDERGYGLKDIPRTGLFWILSAWRVELTERLNWREPFTVQTWPRSMDGVFSEREFLAWHGDRQIARGTSRWILLNAGNGRVARITGAVRAAYELDGRAVFDTPIPNNGRSAGASGTSAFSTTVGRRDIDTNHHVNNIHYLDYALEALPEEVFRNLPSTVEVIFRRQILLGTPIRCIYSRTEDGRHQVEIQSGQEDRLVHHAFVWFY